MTTFFLCLLFTAISLVNLPALPTSVFAGTSALFFAQGDDGVEWAESSDPEDPDEPETPREPGDPDDTDEPETPREPGDPDDTDEPETPREPGDPDDTDEPETPQEPGDPDDPDEPEHPQEPGDPDDTDGPETPREPGDPDDTDGPETPREPGDPDNTDGPEGSEEPDEPEEPGVQEEEEVAAVDAADGITTFQALSDAIKNAEDQAVIPLAADITLTDSITVPGGKHVIIDGEKDGRGGRYTLAESDEKETNLKLGSGASITLRNLELSGHTNYGIVTSEHSQTSATFDSINYVGPQLVYIARSGSGVTVRDSTIHIRQNGNLTKDKEVQEVFETPRIYLDGRVEIFHQMEDVTQIKHAVFFFVGDSGRELEIADNAHVTVHTRSYLFFSDSSVRFHLGENAIFEAYTGGGTQAGHYFHSFTVEKGARFSYIQRDTPAISGVSNSWSYGRHLAIQGILYMGPGSVFEYDSQYTGNDHGGQAGLRLNNTAVTLDRPGLFSVYNPASAFRSSGSSDIAGWGTTTWAVAGVNAVNVWYRGDDAAPVLDSADNLPDRIWNYHITGESPAVSIGETFSFSINANGTISAPTDLTDRLTESDALHGTLVRTRDVKRFALGTIDTFEVDAVSVAGGGIDGSLEGDNAAALYTVDDTDYGIVADVVDGRFTLAYGDDPRPAAGQSVSFAANSRGLRAEICHEAGGALEFTAPNLFYGTHSLPVATGVYRRQTVDGVSRGDMELEVVDSRGQDAAPWTLTVRRSADVDQQLDRWAIPADTLIFRAAAQEEGVPIGYDDVPVLSNPDQGPTTGVSTTRKIWDPDSGILVRMRPGQVEAGEYRAVLVWTFAATPSS